VDNVYDEIFGIFTDHCPRDFVVTRLVIIFKKIRCRCNKSFLLLLKKKKSKIRCDKF